MADHDPEMRQAVVEVDADGNEYNSTNPKVVRFDQTANGVRVGAKDSAGNVVFPDDFNKTLTYNGDGTVNTISFTDGTNTWTQTFAYTNGKVTTDPRWVRT